MNKKFKFAVIVLIFAALFILRIIAVYAQGNAADAGILI